MHDCPGCKVPLHGHEAFCPVCGTKQVVRPEFQLPFVGQQELGSSPLGLFLIVLLAGALLFYAVQSSWIGQVIKRGPEVPAGDSALSPQAAREKLENSILQNLASQSSSGKFTYRCGEKVVDRNCPQPVELTIDVNLKDPRKRHTIVDPVKALMVPAHINTITLNEARSHATVTYSVAGGTANTSDDTDQASPSTPTNENQ